MTDSPPFSLSGFDIRTRDIPAEVPPVHVDPLLNRLYLSRGVRQADELTLSLHELLPWTRLKGIQDAVKLLLEARSQQQRVLVVGDYDTDGATSTALAVLGLRAMGLDVHYLLPNRFEFGYGLSPEIVELALEQSPNLILTVDNGIASFDGVIRAKQAGIKVLVTDHHLPASTLPDAHAIVNPNQPECPFPSKAACGCTVLYYLLIAFRAELRQQGETDLPNLAQWLDLVSLATIADVVPLDSHNRLLVHQGLKRVREGRCRPGIKALFTVAGKSWQEAQASDFGFLVGPRLNAAGRLDDMTVGVQLLLAETEAEARPLADQLNHLNQERRQIEASMLQDVDNRMPEASGFDEVFGAVVYGDHWHEGVVGIVASRIKEKIHKPVVAFAESDNDQLKGSARSVVGVHLRDCLDWIAKQRPALISKFGGHAMAAGLTIPKAGLDEFKQWFSRSVEMFSNADALTPHLWIDGTLPVDQIHLANALLVEQAGPWGQAFPEPQFYGQWPVLESRILGGKHLKLTVLNGEEAISAIAFNVPTAALVPKIQSVRAVYQLSCNRFRGETTLQLILSKLEVTI